MHYPPFHSKRDYNLLFKFSEGHASEAQIEAFKGTLALDGSDRLPRRPAEHRRDR